MDNATYGYIRVSSRDQNEDRQKIAMRKFGAPADCVFMDKQAVLICFTPKVCYNDNSQRLEEMYMTELEAIRARHSVRQYLNKPLKPDELAELRGSADACSQEKFLFTPLEDGRGSAQPDHAFYVKMDLDIAKYRFEIGAGKENVQW